MAAEPKAPKRDARQDGDTGARRDYQVDDVNRVGNVPPGKHPTEQDEAIVPDAEGAVRHGDVGAA